MHLLHQGWILILSWRNKTQAETGYCSGKPLISRNRRRPFEVLAPWWVHAGCSGLYKRQHARLWQEKRSRSRRGSLSSFSAVFFLCVRVGGNGKQPPQQPRLSHEPGSKLTAWWLDLISSHRISRFKSLSPALWKTRCGLLLYLCHNDCAIWVRNTERAKERVVIQYCTSAVAAAHRDHCLWAATGASAVTEQTEVCLQRAAAPSWRRHSSRVCLLSEMGWQLGRACSALWSGPLHERSSHRNPALSHVITPHLRLLFFIISLHRTSITASI